MANLPQAMATTAILLEEAQKLTLQGKIIVHTPHDLRAVLSQKAPQWLIDSRILKYEVVLTTAENIELTTLKILNPAQFLLGDTFKDGGC